MTSFVKAIAQAVISMCVFITCNVWGAYALYERSGLVVTSGAPFFFAGNEVVTYVYAALPVVLGPYDRIINPVVGAARAVAAVAGDGSSQRLAVGESDLTVVVGCRREVVAITTYAQSDSGAEIGGGEVGCMATATVGVSFPIRRLAMTA